MKKLILLISVSIISISTIAQDSLNMRLNYNWFDTTLPYNNYWAKDGENMRQYYNEIWGWHNPVDNREYGVIGVFDGTHIFDVTNPDSVYEADYIPAKDRADIHRDFKTYGNYLYGVADEGNNALQIIDMSYLPDSASLVYESTEFVIQSHNIYIDEGILYMVSPTLTLGNVSGFRMLDIATDPENPILLGDFDLPFGHGNHIHDLFVRDKKAYCSNGNSGFFIYDVADPNNVSFLASIESYSEQGYNHNGWLSEDSKTLFFTDETHGMGIKSFDISDLNNIEENVIFRSHVGAIVHNVFVHGDSLYASYYHDGVYVYNIEDPKCPYEVAYYDTYEEPDGYHSYQGAWGVYPFLPSGTVLVSDFENGLFVLTLENKTSVSPPAECNTGITNINETFHFSISPNISSNYITLKLALGYKGDVKIYNSQGQLTQTISESNENQKIDITSLTNGLYTVIIEEDNIIKTKKFIKN